MTKFALTTRPLTTIAQHGLIVLEYPHRGQRRIWSALNETDAHNRTCEAACRSDTSDYDMDTFDGAMEWNAHDLQRQRIIRFADLTPEMLEDDEEFARECVFLEWAQELEEEEEEAE